MITSHSILLKIGNISDKLCRANQTHIVSSKAVFSEKMWKKTWYSQIGHRRKYNKAHALCILDS